MLSVDSLRSFFYAGHASFTVATPENKIEILKALVGWLGKVSDQLPAETTNTMWDMLISMTDTAELELIHKAAIYESIVDSIKPLNSKDSDAVPSFEVLMLLNKAYQCFSTTVNSLSLQSVLQEKN